MLEIRDLCVSYRDRTVLDHVSISVPKGCILALIGPNGSGKTTFLKAVSSLAECSAEAMMLDGEDLLKMSGKSRACRISYLLQNRQTVDITVQQLVMSGRYPHLEYPYRCGKADMEIVHRSMQQADCINLAERSLKTLSGGELQKAYIAMTLAQDADVVLMDEPSVYLDPVHQLDLMDLAEKLASQSKLVIMVMHDLVMAMEHADYISICADGTITEPQKPDRLMETDLFENVFGVSLSRSPDGNHYWMERKRV